MVIRGLFHGPVSKILPRKITARDPKAEKPSVWKMSGEQGREEEEEERRKRREGEKEKGRKEEEGEKEEKKNQVREAKTAERVTGVSLPGERGT